MALSYWDIIRDNMVIKSYFLAAEQLLSSAIPAGDIAHGLAWGYYYGFLHIVLPGESH